MAIKGKVEYKTAHERAVLVISGLLGLVLLGLDQLTKVWAEQVLVVKGPIEIIPDFFSLTFVTNKGAAWGIFHGYTGFLLIVAVAVLVAGLFYYRKLTEGYVERYYFLAVIFSGIIGNAIDRLWRGEVVDFLDFTFGSYRYPTFNIADCAICCGAALYILSCLLRPAAGKEASRDESGN